MSSFFFYTLFYILMSGCVIYPPTEFVSAGLTIKNVFTECLGSESESFIQYHIRRSVITLFIHSLFPFGYIMGLIAFHHVDTDMLTTYENFSPLLMSSLIVTLFIPIYILLKVHKWSTNNWSMHPIAQCLTVYCNNNTTWLNVASDINIEYRRVDKIVIDTNSITRVIATDNWIIKITSYKILVAHQSDTALIVNRSDTHAISPRMRGVVQFINIEVKPTRTGAQSFDIRLNALDFKDLQDRVSKPITVSRNVVFHKTLLDRFIDAFKEQIAQNSHYDTPQELEQCIGCMQAPSNVKLHKLCGDSGLNEGCTTCFCRPMWCMECMAKWFASRQDENAPETWLSSKCTCPVCRAKFCILDVCLVQRVDR